MFPSGSISAAKERDAELNTESSDHESDQALPSSAAPLSGLTKLKPGSRKTSSKWKPFDYAAYSNIPQTDEGGASEDPLLNEDPTSQYEKGEREEHDTSEDSEAKHYRYGALFGGDRRVKDHLGEFNRRPIFDVSSTKFETPSRARPSVGTHLPTNLQLLGPGVGVPALPFSNPQRSGLEPIKQHSIAKSGQLGSRPSLTLDMRFGSLEDMQTLDSESKLRDSGYATTTTSSRPSFSSDFNYQRLLHNPKPTFDRLDYSATRPMSNGFGADAMEQGFAATRDLDFNFRFPQSQTHAQQRFQQWASRNSGLYEQSLHRPYSHSQEGYIESERKRIAAIIAKSQQRYRTNHGVSVEQHMPRNDSSPPKIGPARTVLYDPMQSRPQNALQSPVKLFENAGNNNGASDPTAIPFHKTFRPFVPQATSEKPPTSSGSMASRNNLRLSDPDPGWHDREARIYHGPSSYLPQGSNPLPIGTGKPAAQHGSTPQNWIGPFTNADAEAPYGTARNALHGGPFNQNAESSKPYCGQGYNLFDREGSSEMIRRPGNTTDLLAVLYQNLSLYAAGPRDYFSKFVTPADWCIDKSAAGNSSFFGEDWGRAPLRVGRDARFRPLPSQREDFSARPAGPSMGTGNAMADKARKGLRLSGP